MSKIEFIKGVSSLPIAKGGSVVTIGAFDGVHLGHQELVTQVRAKAASMGVPSVVVVFEPLPQEYFNKSSAPDRLMRLREKVAALGELSVDKVLCLRFDQRLRAMTAKQFVDQVLIDGLGVRHLIVGDDFRFGCDRDGDFSYLQKYGQNHGFTVSDTHTLEHNEARVSSTRIRKLLNNSELTLASELLGRAYSTSGRVIYGKQLGRRLGFPTLNIGLGRKRMPLSGVFTVKVEHGGLEYSGVANVGRRPTVNGLLKPLLEVHLLNVSKDFYGEFVTVTYLEKLRDEQKFNSVEQLKAQITLDVIQAAEFFSVNE